MPQYDGPTQEQKEKTLMILFYQFAAAPVVYFIAAVLIMQYVFRPGQQAGFAPQKPEVYNMIRLVLAVLGIAQAVFVSRIKNAIESGNAFGLVKAFLGRLLGSKADDMESINHFNVFVITICNSIAIYGLGLFLFNGKIADTCLFFILSEILIWLFRPGKDYIQKVIILKKIFGSRG